MGALATKSGPDLRQKEIRKKHLQKAKELQKTAEPKERKARLMAKRALESGNVVDLIEDIPHEAISALGKRLGFIPSPKPDDCTTRLDLRLLTNKIVNSSRAKKFSHPSSEQSSYKIPSKLKRTNYAKAEPTWDRCVQDAVQRMAEKLDEKLRSNRNNRYKCTSRPNLNKKG